MMPGIPDRGSQQVGDTARTEAHTQQRSTTTLGWQHHPTLRNANDVAWPEPDREERGEDAGTIQRTTGLLGARKEGCLDIVGPSADTTTPPACESARDQHGRGVTGLEQDARRTSSISPGPCLGPARGPSPCKEARELAQLGKTIGGCSEMGTWVAHIGTPLPAGTVVQGQRNRGDGATEKYMASLSSGTQPCRSTSGVASSTCPVVSLGAADLVPSLKYFAFPPRTSTEPPHHGHVLEHTTPRDSTSQDEIRASRRVSKRTVDSPPLAARATASSHSAHALALTQGSDMDPCTPEGWTATTGTRRHSNATPGVSEDTGIVRANPYKTADTLSPSPCPAGPSHGPHSVDLSVALPDSNRTSSPVRATIPTSSPLSAYTTVSSPDANTLSLQAGSTAQPHTLFEATSTTSSTDWTDPRYSPRTGQLLQGKRCPTQLDNQRARTQSGNTLRFPRRCDGAGKSAIVRLLDTGEEDDSDGVSTAPHTSNSLSKATEVPLEGQDAADGVHAMWHTLQRSSGTGERRRGKDSPPRPRTMILSTLWKPVHDRDGFYEGARTERRGLEWSNTRQRPQREPPSWAVSHTAMSDRLQEAANWEADRKQPHAEQRGHDSLEDRAQAITTIKSLHSTSPRQEYLRVTPALEITTDPLARYDTDGVATAPRRRWSIERAGAEVGQTPKPPSGKAGEQMQNPASVSTAALEVVALRESCMRSPLEAGRMILPLFRTMPRPRSYFAAASKRISELAAAVRGAHLWLGEPTLDSALALQP